MGCDIIHTVVEVRKVQARKLAGIDDVEHMKADIEASAAGLWWEVSDIDPVFDWRDYGVFGFLADVRNYSVISSPWKGRGWPDDVSGEASSIREGWGADGHSHTYVTLAELLAFDYDQGVEDRRVTTRRGGIWCTAEPGCGLLTTYRAFLGESFFKDLERLRALGKPPGNVRVLMLFDN